MAEKILPQDQRDIVVTVPRDLWAQWLMEGDLPGAPPSGTYWSFWCGGAVPELRFGEEEPVRDALPLTGCGSDNIWKYLSPSCDPPRCYIVAHERLRGYSPLYAVEVSEAGALRGFIRKGGAVAVTIPEEIRGFRGWRYRWWDRAVEQPFHDWKTAGLPPPSRRWTVGKPGWTAESLTESRSLVEQARDAALSEVWHCGCGWSGPRSALKEDYYGTTEVPGGSRFCNTVCPACGEWLSIPRKETPRVK